MCCQQIVLCYTIRTLKENSCMYAIKCAEGGSSCFIIALWVKSGNRGNLKCLKVNDHYVLIFHQKMFISFLSGAKLSTFYDRYLGLIIYVKYLRSYLQKTWRGVLRSLKFCVFANKPVPRKKAENSVFLRGPLHGANIGQIFL